SALLIWRVWATRYTNVLDIGDNTPMQLPLKHYITPVGAAGGDVIKAGEVIARIHMYKINAPGAVASVAILAFPSVI
ncbi:fimbrial protein, partial [Escherichia coli]|nr:fimbrial protein [Escherichia coli]